MDFNIRSMRLALFLQRDLPELKDEVDYRAVVDNLSQANDRLLELAKQIEWGICDEPIQSTAGEN